MKLYTRVIAFEDGFHVLPPVTVRVQDRSVCINFDWNRVVTHRTVFRNLAP